MRPDARWQCDAIVMAYLPRFGGYVGMLDAMLGYPYFAFGNYGLLTTHLEPAKIPAVVADLPYYKNVPSLQMPADLTAIGPPYEDPAPPLAPRAEANWLHHIGALCYLQARASIAVSSGAAEDSYNVSLLAVRYTAEMFADIASFSKQGNCIFRCQQLIIHPVHAAIWLHARRFGAMLRARAAAGGPSLGVQLWTEIPAICDFLKETDISLYLTCSHGLGHSLAFLVADGIVTATEALDICSLASPVGVPVDALGACWSPCLNQSTTHTHPRPGLGVAPLASLPARLGRFSGRPQPGVGNSPHKLPTPAPPPRAAPRRTARTSSSAPTASCTSGRSRRRGSRRTPLARWGSERRATTRTRPTARRATT